MNKLRIAIRLYTQGNSKRFISNYVGLSRNTVKKYIDRFVALKITWEEIEAKSDQELETLFISTQLKVPPVRHKELYGFFPYADKQLRKTGVTRQLMWEEYRMRYPSGFAFSQFCEHYNRWRKSVNVTPVMRLVHKAGDKLFVDYAGKTLTIIDQSSSEEREVQFFVAILPSSQFTYAQTTFSQKKEDFIECVENALYYFKGVPKAIVPDNLKSAVTKAHRYEPTINETFLSFAEHYATTVLPARSRKPRDKALVEGVIKILYTRIYSVLEKQEFYTLKSLNEAIWLLLKKHNRTRLSGRNYTREELFQEIEAPKLELLPIDRYELKRQAVATVILNGHVLLSQDKHYYSVPYQYIGKKVKLIYSNTTVEIFYGYKRIAIHKRLISPFNYTTIKEHLASAHQFMSEWTPQRFINWGASIDPAVEGLIIKILELKKHPEQAYKSCIGVLSLGKKVGNERLVRACQRALEYQRYNYKIVQTILERGLDRLDDEQPKNELPNHKNIRGKNYYQ